MDIGIKWVAGLVEDDHTPPAFPTTWGLYKMSEDKSPEPLYGHVISVGWKLVVIEPA